MRPNNPPFKPFETKEEREARIKDFIVSALDERASGRADAIAVLALSPASPVMKALLSLSDELAKRRVGAHIVLAGGATASEDETWSMSFSAKFIHEIRLTSNPRVLDGHEQLVVGDQGVWYGDCMRRDPWKRDAFASFLPNDIAATRSGRTTFGRLWSGAQSIYRNAVLSSVIVTTSVGAEPCSVSTMVPAVADDHDRLAAAGASIAETLAAWEPSTRH